MKNTGVSLGTVSMLVGLILCVIKVAGVGLATWPWWVVSAPLWGPFALFAGFMVFVGLIVGARTGSDTLAEKMFDEDDEFTPEEQEKFRRWLEKYGK